MPRLSIPEAAHRLGLAQDTIRKRLRSGALQGEKVKGAGGFRWEVIMADGNEPATAPPLEEVTEGAGAPVDGALVGQMQARIDSLETQLTTRAGEINHLHQLLAQTALNAAPGRSWWKFWR